MSGPLTDDILTDNPRHLWTLCEGTSGPYANSGESSIVLEVIEEYHPLETTEAVCSTVTTCSGLRFTAGST